MPPAAPPNPRDTPAMRQYYRFKRQHPECVLFFRIGDFYEMFDDDAVRVSKALGLTLTQRTEGVPMCGVPFHQLENYLRKAIDRGFRVAVCEQTQDAAEAKLGGGAVIERAVTRVLTPGTLVDDSLLTPDSVRALAAVCFLDPGDAPGARVAAAVTDLSTGRFHVFEATAATLADELVKRQVSELIYAETADGKCPPRVQSTLDALGLSGGGTPQPSWHFRPDESLEILHRHYGVASCAGFGFAQDDPLLRPAGAILRYLLATQAPDEARSETPSSGAGVPPASQRSPRITEGAEHTPLSGGPEARPTRNPLAHLTPPRRDDPCGLCHLDATSIRSLELLRTVRAASAGGADHDGSLLGIFLPSPTFTGPRTAMGKRLLRDWLCRPLCDRARIEARQRCVATLVSDRQTAAALAASLDEVQDVARIAARLALGRASPRDLVALGRSLAQVNALRDAVGNAPAFAQTHAAISGLGAMLAPLAERIRHACVESPPSHLRDGGLIKDGHDAELDEVRLLQRDSAAWMAEYQKKLVDEHTLPSLKVGYNKIFGYYIELPAAQSRRAPDAFTRKQTLKNAERYITPELKDFENKVTTAQSRALAREQAIFDDLCAKAAALIPAIGAFADAAAELDALAAFADKAVKRRWVRPEIADEPVLRVHQARHPVLDELLDGRGGTSFVPNDIELGGRAAAEGSAGDSLATLALITGPNMAGKSTYIRTAALLTILAHTGSFVPADRAVIGLTDRVFTRIGADDALHAGQSTFMVEMTETARILHHATERSLVVLDEIGRGTSTLDGLSLAWAIAETLGGIGIEGARDQGIKSEPPAPTRSLVPSIPRSLPPSPRTLFATHYHELTDLEDRAPGGGRITNLHVAVRELGDDIVFLHRILPGRTDRSYGIHVAKLAGLPPATIARAREVLESLAVHHHGPDGAASEPAAARNGKKPRVPAPPQPAAPPPGAQLSLFTEYLHHPAVDTLRELKLDALTPLQAFDALRRLKDLTDTPAQ